MLCHCTSQSHSGVIFRYLIAPSYSDDILCFHNVLSALLSHCFCLIILCYHIVQSCCAVTLYSHIIPSHYTFIICCHIVHSYYAVTLYRYILLHYASKFNCHIMLIDTLCCHLVLPLYDATLSCYYAATLHCHIMLFVTVCYDVVL